VGGSGKNPNNSPERLFSKKGKEGARSTLLFAWSEVGGYKVKEEGYLQMENVKMGENALLGLGKTDWGRQILIKGRERRQKQLRGTLSTQ